MPSARTLLCAVVVVLWCWPGRVLAHQSSFTYANLEVADDRKSLHYEVRLNSMDLFEALALAEDRDASDAEILSGAERLRSYVWQRIELTSDRDDCELRYGDVRIVTDSARFATLPVDLRCSGIISKVSLDYTLFFDLDPQHVGLLTIDDKIVQLRYPDDNRLEYDLGKAPPSSAFGFLRSGVDHILFGLDHILFLISLLLVVGLARTGGELTSRSALSTLKTTSIVVTSFTLAHSITLIIAALGIVTLPSRLVETFIALSIVYVAVENVMRPDPPYRYVVTFLFGLMHGLGFASMLRPLLPPEGVIVPLVVFNLGVEIGQLVIVVLALPLLLVVIRRLGPWRYHRWIVPVCSLALTIFGLAWACERAFGIELVPI